MTRNKNIPPVLIHIIGGIELVIRPKGSKIEISISKIRKTIAIKKNRMEKGIREVFFGSNPHSKGEAFSRSKIVFFENKVERIIRRDLIKTAMLKATNINLIT